MAIDYYEDRLNEIRQEFQEVRGKYANKYLILHDEQKGEEDKLNKKFSEVQQKQQTSQEIKKNVAEVVEVVEVGEEEVKKNNKSKK
jgi:hypothetical protein